MVQIPSLGKGPLTMGCVFPHRYVHRLTQSRQYPTKKFFPRWVYLVSSCQSKRTIIFVTSTSCVYECVCLWSCITSSHTYTERLFFYPFCYWLKRCFAFPGKWFDQNFIQYVLCCCCLLVDHLWVCLYFWDRVSLCLTGWPVTQSVAQVGLELSRDPSSLPSECWD